MIKLNCAKSASERKEGKEVMYIRVELNPADESTELVKKLYMLETLKNAKLDQSVEQ